MLLKYILKGMILLKKKVETIYENLLRKWLKKKAERQLEKWNLKDIDFDIEYNLITPGKPNLEGKKALDFPCGYYKHDKASNKKQIRLSYIGIQGLKKKEGITYYRAMLGILAHEAAHALDPMLDSRNEIGRELFASYYGAYLVRKKLRYKETYWKTQLYNMKEYKEKYSSFGLGFGVNVFKAKEKEIQDEMKKNYGFYDECPFNLDE